MAGVDPRTFAPLNSFPYRGQLRADPTRYKRRRRISRISASIPTGFLLDRRGEKGALRRLFTIYFIGSGLSFTVGQFLSARLMFSVSFLRHSVVQYFV